MNEILDAEQKLSYHYSTASYQNFKQALFLLLFFIIGVFIVAITGIQNDILILVFGIPVFIAVLISIVGFVRGIKSILHKEPSNSKMIIGLIGNFIVICLFVSLTISNIMDTQVIQ